MDDLISRQAAIEAVSRGCQEFRGIFAECEKNLNELPTAEKKGKWVWKIGMVKCDQCLRAIRRIDCDGLLNFCPNCGAQMEEGNEHTHTD